MYYVYLDLQLSLRSKKSNIVESTTNLHSGELAMTMETYINSKLSKGKIIPKWNMEHYEPI